MTCVNPIKNKIERKLTDDQMECKQFSICDYALRKVKEVPFFHY